MASTQMRQIPLKEEFSSVHLIAMGTFFAKDRVMQAPGAIALVLRRKVIPFIITAMGIFQFIIDTLLEWARAILLEILGRRVERFVRRCIKRWRNKKSTKAEAGSEDRA
jgi:hypothetical protein